MRGGIIVLAGLGTAHILVRTATYGAAIITDSFYFLSTALNFLAGEGWRDFLGDPLVWWPPLFPLLLAAFGWVGIDPLEAGRWINAAAFGLTILAAGCWLRSNLRSQWLALVATAIITASLPLSDIASYLLTDALFVLFTLLALMQLATFLNRKTAAPLWWAAVCTALAALTRYPGVVLIGTGVLVLLVRRAPPLAARLKDAVVFGAISSIPLAGVLTRNWVLSDTLTGGRSGSGQSLFDSLSRVVDVFREWAIPPNAPDGLGYLLSMAAGLVILAAGAVVVLAGRGFGVGGKSASFGLGPALPFGVFAVAYLVFVVVVVPLTIPTGIEARFLLPMYVPLLLAAVLLLDRFLCIEAGGWMAAVRYGLASFVLLGTLAHLCFSAHRNLTITAEAYGAGFHEYSYNGRYWQQSETLNYIRNHHIEGRIYSNEGPLVWFWDRTAAPGKYQSVHAGLSLLARQMMQWTKDGIGAHIVWFRAFGDQGFYGYDLMDLRVLPGVETVADLSDGAVFRVTAAEPFDEAKHRARRQRYVDQLLEQAGELVIRADSTWPISTWGAERADEQVARAGWDVYRTGRKLTYHKQPCASADVQTIFLLQVSPNDPADLSADRRQHGFDNLDFYFDQRGGVRVDDQCVVSASLPDYPIGSLYIGRWMAGNDRMLWEMKAEPLAGERHPAQRQRYAEQLIAQTDEQVTRAGWDVYRTGRKLIYRKQPCAPDDVQAKFILHVTPADPNELPANRQRHGFESLGFHFDQRGFQLDDQCIAIAQLPAYAIDRIRVGQWISKDNRTVWEAEFLEIGE